MDFVLESGTGDLEDRANPEALAFAESSVANDNETPLFPRVGVPKSGRDSSPPRVRSRPLPSPGERSWPLRDPEEAYLLRHFVDRIACFVSGGLTRPFLRATLMTPQFDCTDRQQHFAVHIPYRARYCDTLFNAIMAMSARHLSCTTEYDTFVSDHYYQACLETLIPSLNDHGVTMDDDLLAATVILRLLEEFDGEQS